MQTRSHVAALIALAGLIAACGQSKAPQQDGAPTIVVPPDNPAGGAEVSIQESPFRLCFGAVCTAEAGVTPAPLPYSYIEGPRPQVNPSTLAAFPAFGWVVGTTENAVIPTFIWQGNRLSGRDTGTLYEVTEAVDVRETADGVEIDLATNYAADPTPALLAIRALPSGVTEARLTPPPGMAAEGIAVTLFTIDTPPGEGLFGMGARKDFFNQRGLLRNVWTEQQNTGLGAADDLDFGGAGAPINAPTSGELAALGLNPDVDDAALAEERTSFPNGAQAAYWVEAFVVGARGWAAWTSNMHFQRLDLAATDGEKLRWQLVDADEITLLFADGGIEAASRKYTDYWGRAPAPGLAAYLPWIDTLNQGEGEAAPNGQGFWGGQRARCEVESFIAKSADNQIPFGLIGVEGWQVIPPAHPACLATPTDAICSDASGFPDSEQAWQDEVAAGTSFFNTVADCPQADQTFLNYVADQGFEITGYWNFFHTDPACAGDAAAGCTDDTLSVPLASQQAFYAGREGDLYVKDAQSGEDHEVTTNRGGISTIVDFTSDAVVDFWAGQLARMFELGIDIFMHDFGELTTDDMSFAEGENLTESHNLYAFNYQRAGRLALDRFAAANPDADFAPYMFSRAGMTGACSFTPGVFPGDESTSWDAGHGLPSVVPAMLNLALSGCYAFTTDVGGYFDFTAPRTTEDLFIRWSQLAALTPVMRLHSSTFNGSVFPWTWADGDHADAAQFDTIDIFRRYARLKVNLIPLVDHWAQRAATDGTIGPVRPLILEDASPEAASVDYQWLLGDDILAAPVVAENATDQSIYFPAGGRWRQVVVTADGLLEGVAAVFDGGQTATIELNPSLSDIPVFLRCGANNALLPVVGEPTDCAGG